MGEETGHITGTKDKDYNLIRYVESCLENTLRLETYLRDAERDGDGEMAELFRKAQADSRKGAELGKKLLADRLAPAAGGGGPDGGSAVDTPVRAAGDALEGAGDGAVLPPDTGRGTGGAPAFGDRAGDLPQDPTAP